MSRSSVTASGTVRPRQEEDSGEGVTKTVQVVPFRWVLLCIYAACTFTYNKKYFLSDLV